MPLKRTPPPTVTSPSRSESEPDLSGTIKQDYTTNIVNVRQKRAREEVTMGDLMDEMRNMMREFKIEQEKSLEALQGSLIEISKQQDKKLDCLQSAMAEVRKQNEEIQGSIEFLSQQYTELRDKVSQLEDVQKQNATYIRILETKIENIDQQNRRTSIEIRNIPVSNTETKQDLLNIFHKISTTLNSDAKASDVCDIFRVNSKVPSSKPIICCLNSVLLKEQLLKHLREFNTAHRANKLNTEHLQIQGPHQPIFISESLTPRLKRLYAVTRGFAGANGFQFCWVSRGRIYLRKRQGDKLIYVESETDLTRLDKTI
jgi:chromosome segregation ATPase